MFRQSSVSGPSVCETLEWSSVKVSPLGILCRGDAQSFLWALRPPHIRGQRALLGLTVPWWACDISIYITNIYISFPWSLTRHSFKIPSIFSNAYSIKKTLTKTTFTFISWQKQFSKFFFKKNYKIPYKTH